MGLFDTFHDKCPNCGRDLEIQIKFFNPYMEHLRPGDETHIFNIYEDIIDLRFVASEFDVCEYCKCRPIVVIKDRKFIGFELSEE